MRFVIDTNQVHDIVRSGPPHTFCPTLVIAPLIWSEFISQQRLTSCLPALALYDLAFGMGYPHILDALRCLNEDQIRHFVPVYPADSEPHIILRQVFCSPGPRHFRYAKELAHDANQDRKRWLSWFEQRKKENRDATLRGENIELAEFSNIEEADSHFFYGDKGVRRRTLPLIGEITAGDKEVRALSADSLCDAVLANPSLKRFLRLHITFSLAYIDSWSTETMNNLGDLQANRNDVPDIMLALYAADGDTILTNDKRLQAAFRFCDPLEKVRVSTWYAESQGIG